MTDKTGVKPLPDIHAYAAMDESELNASWAILDTHLKLEYITYEEFSRRGDIMVAREDILLHKGAVMKAIQREAELKSRLQKLLPYKPYDPHMMVDPRSVKPGDIVSNEFSERHLTVEEVVEFPDMRLLEVRCVRVDGRKEVLIGTLGASKVRLISRA